MDILQANRDGTKSVLRATKKHGEPLVCFVVLTKITMRREDASALALFLSCGLPSVNVDGLGISIFHFHPIF